MKYLIVLIFFSTNYYTICAQRPPSDDIRAMMDTSVKMTYQNIKYIALNSGQDLKFLENIYLMDSRYMPLNYLSDSVNKIFKFINIYEKENRKLIIKGIPIWEVTGELKNNLFLIRVNEWTLKYYPKDKQSKYHLSTSGGNKIYFEYDCVKEKWVFKSINFYGI